MELGQIYTSVKYCKLVQNGGNEAIEQYDLVEKVKGNHKVSLCNDKPKAIGIALNEDLVNPGGYFWVQLFSDAIDFGEVTKIKVKI